MDPDDVSVTVHEVPAGRSSTVREVSPAGVPAGITNGSLNAAPQSICSTMSPCSPAPSPVTAFVTFNAPVAKNSAVAWAVASSSVVAARMSRCASVTVGLLPS